jgi:hypothetical protein
LPLPLLLHAAPGASLSRLTELLPAASLARCCLLNAGLHLAADAEALQAWAAAGGALCFSAAGLSDGGAPVLAAEHSFLRDAKLLLASCAPSNTPQTLSDEYLRTVRNEPANLSQVAADLAAAVGCDLGLLSQTLWATSLAFLCLSDGNAAPPAVQQLTADPSAAFPPPDIAAALASVTVTSPPADSDLDSLSDSEPDDAAAEPSTAPSTLAPSQVAQFCCRRCRLALFPAAALSSHSGGGGSDENQCVRSLFLPLLSATPTLRLSAAAEAAESRASCAGCGAKLGRAVASISDQLLCGCGAVVCGPVAKLSTSRVDFRAGEGGMEGCALALRGELEAAAGEEGDNGERARVREKAAKAKRENRNNLSNYRNKG